MGGVDLHAEAPLKKGSKLHVGHGSEGGVPFRFVLLPESVKELSFVKLYVSTSPIELNAIQQSSPFESLLDDGRKAGRHRVSPKFWSSRVIKLIQLRERTPNNKSKYNLGSTLPVTGSIICAFLLFGLVLYQYL